MPDRPIKVKKRGALSKFIYDFCTCFTAEDEEEEEPKSLKYAASSSIYKEGGL